MSYKTLEVDLDNGRVHPSGEETLPAKARALLTIITLIPEAASDGIRSLGDAMRGLKIQGQGKFTDLSTNKQHLDYFEK